LELFDEKHSPLNATGMQKKCKQTGKKPLKKAKRESDEKKWQSISDQIDVWQNALLSQSDTNQAILAYTDGSAEPTNPGFGGAGVVIHSVCSDTTPAASAVTTVHQNQIKKTEISRALGHPITNNFAELTAIEIAFDWVLKTHCNTINSEIKKESLFEILQEKQQLQLDPQQLQSSQQQQQDHQQPKRRILRILSDSHYSLDMLSKNWNAKANIDLIQRIREKLSVLRNTHKWEVYFVWVPGHWKIQGNIDADRLASDGSTASKLKLI
jgi:ribonuclease HI